MTKIVENKTFDEERALYNLTDAVVRNVRFEGPADGESVLKEARNVTVTDTVFNLRYPLWHVKGFAIENSELGEPSRASLWYAENGKITDTVIGSVKAIRECADIDLSRCKIISPEFGWKSDRIRLSDCNLTSEYAFFDSKNVVIKNLSFKGKYSFQYMENLVIEDSYLDTKDAFWHSKNVTVRNSTIKGEYLAWFSDGLTLERCKIIGTQPLCYCKNLRLIDCETEGADLAFEYSDVEATVKGSIMSVKNPKSGNIVADEIGEIILENSIMNSDCKISERGKSK